MLNSSKIYRDQVLTQALTHLEKQIDEQLKQPIDTDDLQELRNRRIQELKELSKKKQEWLANGHGQYTELYDEKEFFEVSKKSPNVVIHFYRDSTERCKIVDKHLQILAGKHIEALFCKINAEKCPFLTQRLRIKIIPTVGLIVDSKTKDFIVGFTDLGNRDDFTTATMEWRIAQSGVIEYSVMTIRHAKSLKSYLIKIASLPGRFTCASRSS